MKTNLLLSFLLPFVFLACTGTHEPDAGGSHSESDSATLQKTIGKAQASVYACPMHPEVRRPKPGQCPECGMDLELTDAPEVAKTRFDMDFAVTPSTPAAGKPVELALRPSNPTDPATEVPLDVQHEKKIHLIVVSKDLRFFDHIHPEYNPDGLYKVNYTFPHPDSYVLFADYKPTEGNHQTATHELQVPDGPKGMGNRPYPIDEKALAPRLSSTVGGYTVTLVSEGTTGGILKAGAPLLMKALISQNGKALDASTLEDYLGAKAHVVVIRQGTLEYLHVHPTEINGELELRATFAKPGVYRAWVQFQAAGKVHTADFVLELKTES